MQQTLLKLKPNKLNDESPIILDNIVLVINFHKFRFLWKKWVILMKDIKKNVRKFY